MNNKHIQFLIASILLLAAQMVNAAGGGHEGPIHVPTEFVFQQTFNFLLAIFVLWYFLRKTVRAHFKARHAEYHDVVRKVESAKVEAEDLKKTLNEKMVKLNTEAEANAHKAKSEADEMHQKLVHDAKGLSDKLIIDAKASIDIELQKAKQQLKAELLEMSLEAAQRELKSEVSDKDDQRLKEQFVENIQAVN
jgi:F-type H+-transporting ATPase subunit b